GGEVYTLKGAETPYRLLVEAMNEGAATMTGDGTLLYANHRLAELVGMPLEALLGLSLQSLVQPDDRPRLANLLEDSRGGQGTMELHLSGRDSNIIPVQVSVRALAANSTSVLSVVVTDLRKRKQVENELRHLNRALRTISRGNQTLVRAKTEAEFLEAICRAAVEEGGFRMAWIGYVENDENKTVRVVARAGKESESLTTAGITWAEEQYNRGPTGRCIRTRRAA